MATGKYLINAQICAADILKFMSALPQSFNKPGLFFFQVQP
jgi:hypothetical protein